MPIPNSVQTDSCGDDIYRCLYCEKLTHIAQHYRQCNIRENALELTPKQKKLEIFLYIFKIISLEIDNLADNASNAMIYFIDLTYENLEYNNYWLNKGIDLKDDEMKLFGVNCYYVYDYIKANKVPPRRVYTQRRIGNGPYDARLCCKQLFPNRI